jgi:hypothetical protein
MEIQPDKQNLDQTFSTTVCRQNLQVPIPGQHRRLPSPGLQRLALLAIRTRPRRLGPFDEFRK